MELVNVSYFCSWWSVPCPFIKIRCLPISFSMIISRDSSVNSRFPQWNIIHLELKTRIHVMYLYHLLYKINLPPDLPISVKSTQKQIIVTQVQNLKVFNVCFPYSISDELFIFIKYYIPFFLYFLFPSTVALGQMLVILHAWTSLWVLKTFLLPSSLVPIYLLLDISKYWELTKCTVPAKEGTMVRKNRHIFCFHKALYPMEET